VLLALHPEHQEPIFREALALFGSDDSGTCSYAEGYTALPYTLATLQEGLRVAGPVTMMTKVAVEDTYLPARTNDGERTKVFVPKGAIVRENISGVHYNGQSTACALLLRRFEVLIGAINRSILARPL
jgi:hypothetical protein